MTDLSTPAGRLADARDKLHLLLTGQLAMVVIVDNGGYSVHYSRTNIEALKAYVSQLEAEVAGRRTIGAIGVIF